MRGWEACADRGHAEAGPCVGIIMVTPLFCSHRNASPPGLCVGISVCEGGREGSRECVCLRTEASVTLCDKV